MNPEELSLVKKLLTDCRVLSLGVLVDGKPHVGLLPFVAAADYRSALVHASQLARHSRGLQPGSPFSVLIHASDEQENDALQVPRVTISGTVQLVAQADADFESSRHAFIDRFPSSAQAFRLGDFNLYRLHFEWGRLVSGFARAITLSPDSFKELSES
jgi:putative heme iron utilization protein